MGILALYPRSTPTAGGLPNDGRPRTRWSNPLQPSPARSPPAAASVAGHAPFPRDEVRSRIRAVWKGEDQNGSRKFKALKS
jgi:hypothetical protein